VKATPLPCKLTKTLTMPSKNSVTLELKNVKEHSSLKTRLQAAAKTLEKRLDTDPSARDRLYQIREHIRRIETEEHAAELRSAIPTFRAFIVGHYEERLFTPAVYKLLSSLFGFIAHFDRPTFYAARFADLGDRVVTVGAIMRWEARGPYANVESEVQEMLSSRGELERLTRELEAQTEKEERSELKRLLEKYPP
jgi:hypothetical protein